MSKSPDLSRLAAETLPLVRVGITQRTNYVSRVQNSTVHGSRWSVSTPWFVSAVSGSCAEIPCTFDYPVYGRNPWGMWLKGGSDPRTPGVSVVYDPRDLGIININYRGRTELNGNFTKKQCSLRIKDTRKSDEGDYYFRLKITNPRNTIEQYASTSHVKLSILDRPGISVSGELIAGQPAQLTCSITHSCPSANLELEWTYDQDYFPFLPETKTSEQNVNSFDGSRKVSSIFTFTPSPDHQGKRLGCKLIVGGVAATVQEALTLDVKYKPSIVSGPTCTSSESGIHCTCSVRANPPANITWGLNGRNITGDSSAGEVISWAVNGHLVQSSLTLTHPNGTGIQISCVAANEHGVSVGKYQLHSAGTLSWKIVMPIRTAAAVIILIAVIALVKIEGNSHRVKAKRKTLVLKGYIQPISGK